MALLTGTVWHIFCIRIKEASWNQWSNSASRVMSVCTMARFELRQITSLYASKRYMARRPRQHSSPRKSWKPSDRFIHFSLAGLRSWNREHSMRLDAQPSVTPLIAPCASASPSGTFTRNSDRKTCHPRDIAQPLYRFGVSKPISLERLDRIPFLADEMLPGLFLSLLDYYSSDCIRLVLLTHGQGRLA